MNLCSEEVIKQRPLATISLFYMYLSSTLHATLIATINDEDLELKVDCLSTSPFTICVGGQYYIYIAF